MKKTYLLLLAITIFGCAKIPSEIVDVKEEDYKILAVNTPVNLSYKLDSALVTSVKLNAAGTSQVLLEILDPDGNQLEGMPVILQDNGNISNADSVKGDNIFSAKLNFSQNYKSGKYKLNYYVPNNGINNLVAVSSLNYFNGLQNYPPELTDLVMPDTVSVGERFTFTVKAYDPNGLTDVKLVFFSIYKQDGSISATNLVMVDNGDFTHFGDLTANDGIYSYSSNFTQSAQGQLRKFVFQSVDNSDSLSNIITHYIYIK